MRGNMALRTSGLARTWGQLRTLGALVGIGQRHFADAVILAGGRSTRMRGMDKLFVDYGGWPLLAWTVDAVSRAHSVRHVIIVAREDRVSEFRGLSWVREIGATVVAGGDRRQDSVAAGVEAATADVVLIHDGARPLVTPQVVDRVASDAWQNDLTVPVVPVPESMLRIEEGQVVGELDKTDLHLSQTPHGIRRELLLQAYARQDPRGPEPLIDEPSLVRSVMGTTISAVEGDSVNLKVTMRGDEELASALLESQMRRALDDHSGTQAPVAFAVRPRETGRLPG